MKRLTSPVSEKRLTKVKDLVYQERKASLFENSFWNIRQLSQQLNISEKTIRDWVFKRQIPFKKIGKLVRFDPSEIHQWIEERNKYGD